jgi:hypothetical protein
MLAFVMDNEIAQSVFGILNQNLPFIAKLLVIPSNFLAI